MAFLSIQGFLGQPQKDFNIAQYDVESALVDNLIYSFVSELEKKTSELEIYFRPDFSNVNGILHCHLESLALIINWRNTKNQPRLIHYGHPLPEPLPVCF